MTFSASNDGQKTAIDAQKEVAYLKGKLRALDVDVDILDTHQETGEGN